MSNTITAYFKGRVGVAEAVYQNDYGIVMAFDSIDLPAHFDCYFSRLNQEEALPGVGADSRVAIPNSILADPGNVTVHVPLHTGENDSEVEYVVYFKVIGRARPIDDGTPTQMTAIEQALALLQNPITNIEQIVNEALAFTGETFEEMQEDLDEWKTDTEEDLGTWKSGVESDFDNLEAQFDTAVAAVTTDTEVTNIRVGDDNVIYTTAGEAVRTQFSNVKAEINIFESVEAGWYQGTFSTSTGVVESSTTRCVTNKLYMHKGAVAEIKCNGQQRIAGYFNAGSGAFTALNQNWLGTDLTYTATEDGYLIVQVRKSNSNPTIEPSEVAVTIRIKDSIQKTSEDAIYAKNLSNAIGKGAIGTKVTLTSDILVSAVVNAAGKWALPSNIMRSGIIDVSSHKYKTMMIMANDTMETVYSLLTSDSHTVGDDVNFADSGRHVLQKGEYEIVDISNTSINYICVLKYSINDELTRVDAEPKSIVFLEDNNAYAISTMLSMFKLNTDETNKNTEDISTLQAEVYNLKNLRRDVPANQGVRNAYKKAMQLKNLPWTGLSAIPNDTSATGISAGSHTGVDYSSVKEYDKFVGFNVSLKSFMTAAHNPYSLLYTEDVKDGRSRSEYGITYHGKNCGAYFGIVCNVFVFFALGFPIPWNTAEWHYLESEGVLEKIYNQSASGVELMDVIWEPGHGNIIVDIYRDSRGNPVKIFWAESVQNFPQVHEYTPEQFNARLASRNGIIYRYKDLYKNLEYRPSDFVAIEGETVEPYDYNEDVCTFAGDYAAFREGEEIWINYNLGETEYTGLSVYKGETLIASYSLSSGHKISIGSSLTAGKYTAVLTGNGTSEPTHFEVIETNVSMTNNSGDITVQFSSTNGVAIYAQMTYLDGSSRGIIPIPTDNSGRLEFNANEILQAQYPDESFAQTTYLKVFFKGDYGTVRNNLISLELT